jgi:homoserine dehydrogenase
MSRVPLNIGLFGFGCVGYGLYQVLERTEGLKARISRVCIKNAHKPREASASLFTTDREALLGDPSINVIVELIDDADAAFSIVSEALRRGKAVVTANKKMIAEHFTELLALQQQYNMPLLYEGACCASIPIIRNLEEYYDNDLLESIEGIVNGSTNYILTKTFSEQLPYATALQQAQAAGYAESDPSLDTGGFDAKYKLLILIAHAFGLVLQPEQIFNVGIDGLGELELRYAREKGYKIKLVAKAYKDARSELSFFVMPKFVAPHEKLYQVDDVFNGVITKTCFADTQFFVGKGAGAYPTASAVLSDISALSYNYRYEYKKLSQGHPFSIGLESGLKIMYCYQHHALSISALLHYFDRIDERYQNGEGGYVTGRITLGKLKELAGRSMPHGEPGSVVLFDTEDEEDLALLASSAYQSLGQRSLRLAEVD